MNLHKMIDEIPLDRPVAILIRHAEREAIAKVEDSVTAQLNDAGRAAAQALGEQLAPLATVRAFHSPIDRCAETAACLTQGLRSAGAEAEVVSSRVGLGGPYMHDWQIIMERVLEVGAVEMTRRWFAGKLEPELAQDPYLAARHQLQILVEQLEQSEEPGCFLDVTHDWNVLLIRHHFLNLDVDTAGWPEYLEAIIAFLDDGVLVLRWKDVESRWKLPLPAQPPAP